MRKREQAGSLTVQAVAGTYAVLLGMSLSHRSGILGFGIHRTDHTEGEAYWLRGMKTFPSVVSDPEPGQSFPLNHHPVQSFQWGDYTAKPGHDYTYRVVALGGAPGALVEKASVSVNVRAEPVDDGTHGVWFNRGVAASQAYRSQFGGPPPKTAADDDPRLKWLSRGLAEAFQAFVAEATGPEWGLRGAFYEFTWPAGLLALQQAKQRNADVRLVVHGRDKDTPGNNLDRTAENSKEAAGDAGILGLITWRDAPNKGALQHNKFLVLTHNGAPVAVWTGSTNLTRGAVFGHSNVAHVIRDAGVAGDFLSYWQQLDGNVPTAALRSWCETHNAVALGAGLPPGMSTVFSPRATTSTVLSDYADVFDSATSTAHITGAFGLNQVFVSKLDHERAIPRTVLLDKEQGVPIPKGDHDVRISTGAHLDSENIGQWAKESLTGFNTHVRYVHTKIIMVDPLTDTPVVLTGSANYSAASTSSNEENTVIIEGNTRVADIYLTEYHRIFMHFPFRMWAQNQPQQGPPRLLEDDSWSDDYYQPGHWRQRQRKAFSGS